MDVEPGRRASAPCPRCGGPAGLVSGLVSRDRRPYARYFLDWCEGEEARRLVATLSIGDWSEQADPDERSCVVIEMREDGWRLLDEPHRSDSAALGRFVPDAAVRRRGAVEQVRSIARIVIAEDPSAAAASAWVEGERDTALAAADG